MESKLYVSSDSDSYSDSDFKLEDEQGLLIEQFQQAETFPTASDLKRKFELLNDGSESDSDSDSASEWEDVPIEQANPFEKPQDSFTITVNLPQIDKKAQRRAEGIANRKKRVTTHHLGILAYLLHGYYRNKWINNSIVQKKLRKILPKKLIKTSKSFWKSLSNQSTSSSLEKELIYVLKYAVKWFRLNFRVDSNGFRVLGYIPADSVEKDFEEYYPSAKPVDGLKAFASIAGKLQHNRDTGAQLFTCILRILGFLARLVFSLPLLPVTNDPNFTQPKVDVEKLHRIKDNDLLYPYFWTEVVNPINKDEIFVIENICFHEEEKRFLRLKRYRRPEDDGKLDLANYYTPHFHPVVNSLNRMTMHFVVSLTEFNTILETSSRYMPDVAHRWFKKLDLRTLNGRSTLLVRTMLRILNKGNKKGIDSLEMETLDKISILNCSIPNTYSAMKRNPNVVTPSSLRYNEVIPESVKPLGYVKLSNTGKKEPVYFKSHAISGKSEQQWKLLGRSIKPEERNSPIRTTTFQKPRTLLKRRRFNLNVINGQDGENNIHLFSYLQTCPYVPLEGTTDAHGIKKLPRNIYGNIEIFRPWMQPHNCTWIKFFRIREIFETYQRKNEMDFEFVPVVTGFNFTIRPGFAVPQVEGILVFKENEMNAKKLWFTCMREQRRKEAEAKDLRALKGWKLFIKGLKIKERLDSYD